MATKKSFTIARGWHKVAPKTQQQRRALKDRCGDKAFLQPKDLKYPIMAKSGPCVINCQGLLAAKNRSSLMITRAKNAGQSPKKFQSLRAKAQRKGKTAHCAWAH